MTRATNPVTLTKKKKSGSNGNDTNGNRNLINEHNVEWVRCNNVTCGKWRSVARGYDVDSLLRRSIKRKWPYNGATSGSNSVQNSAVFYCWMNTWDQTQASCTAPQESLYACRWNMNK